MARQVDYSVSMTWCLCHIYLRKSDIPVTIVTENVTSKISNTVFHHILLSEKIYIHVHQS